MTDTRREWRSAAIDLIEYGRALERLNELPVKINATNVYGTALLNQELREARKAALKIAKITGDALYRS